MQNYSANEELKQLLLKQGFIETTSEENKKKGRPSFKLSKNGKKEIYFNYIKIEVIYSPYILDSRIHLSQTELKHLLLFFKLPAADYKLIDPTYHFRFDKIEERLESLQHELQKLEEFDINNAHRRKVERLFETLDTIQFN